MIALLACTESATTRSSGASVPEDRTVEDTSTVPKDTDTPTRDSASDRPGVDTAPTDTATTDTTTDPCAETSGTLSAGEEHEIGIDDHTGDEESTEPKEDANDGADGDEPTFQRHNVARAHCTDRCYWYTSSHQEDGEPDPDGEQWVDYLPDFAALGVGWYAIHAVYRQSDNRADYEAIYAIDHRDGTTEVLQDQREGTEFEEIDLGTYWMCPGSTVRIEDPGSESITFNEVEFERG